VSITLILQQGLNGVVLASDYALFALGLSVTWGVLKVLNLAHAELFTFGGVVAILIGLKSDLGFVPVILIAAAACGVLSVLIDAIAFWPLRFKRLDIADMELTSMITSLGISTILVTLANHLFNNEAQHPAAALFAVSAWHFGGLIVTNVQVLVTATALILTFATWWVVKRTKFGRALRGLAFSPDMARVVGVRTEPLYRVTLFACGALAGIAGVLLLILLQNVDAYSGSNLLLKGIAIIVLAGAGEILGLLVGAVVLGFAETLGSLWLPSSIQTALPFLLILVVLLIRPSGLFGRSDVIRT
jgi:branched-chain amino acid transport system permease protein